MKTTILDNEGYTVDRYTVIIDDDVYIMSHNPRNPQGVNQYCGTVDDLGNSDVEIYVKHLQAWGMVIVELDNLSEEVKTAITERMDSY